MDFHLSRAQELLQRSIRAFARAEVAPQALELDEKAELPKDLMKKLAEMGMIGIVIPREYGGSAMGHVARLVSVEEISQACASLGLFLQATPLGLWVLLHFGSADQKRRYIPPVVSGNKLMCMAVTESTGGSDPLAIATTAKRNGATYVVNGRKCWITNGSVADLCVFVARTGDKAKDLSAFVVEKETPGFEPGRVENHAGLRAMNVSEVVFTDCTLPRENLIGQEGEGLKAALQAISEIGRMGNVGVSLGVAKAAYATARKFAQERVLSGKPIAHLQAVQFMLADMDIDVEAAHWLAYHAAWLLDQGKSGREIEKQIAQAKAYCSEAARRTAIHAVQLHGAYGTLPEYHVIRYLRDSLEGISSAGTNEIMRVIVGRTITRER
jgi:alkylation response protein AidB-like acyl-CoA dehydrogenase